MPAKTYIPKLVYLCKLIITYISRWREVIRPNLTEAQNTLLDNLLDAALHLTAAIEIIEEL